MREESVNSILHAVKLRFKTLFAYFAERFADSIFGRSIAAAKVAYDVGRSRIRKVRNFHALFRSTNTLRA